MWNFYSSNLEIKMRTTSMPECQRAGATVVEPRVWCCLALHLFPKNTVTEERDLVLHQNVVASTREWKLAGSTVGDWGSHWTVSSGTGSGCGITTIRNFQNIISARFCFVQNLVSLVVFQAEALILEWTVQCGCLQWQEHNDFQTPGCSHFHLFLHSHAHT